MEITTYAMGLTMLMSSDAVVGTLRRYSFFPSEQPMPMEAIDWTVNWVAGSEKVKAFHKLGGVSRGSLTWTSSGVRTVVTVNWVPLLPVTEALCDSPDGDEGEPRSSSSG